MDKYEEIMSFRHIREAQKDCAKGVRWKSSVQNFEINSMQWASELHQQILNETYKSKGFYKFWLVERGKRRFIQSVHISERCIQKALNNYGLKPLIEPRLIYDNGASREGKGTEFAIKRLRQHLATHYRKYRKQGGVLIMDFHDYFNSIPHDQLYNALQHIIEDNKTYKLAKKFIECFGDKGLGLGSEISQVMAIFYPNYLDHYIKEKLHIKGYGRYMDDSYVIHQDINYLRYVLKEVKRLLKDLGLELNPKTKIIRFNKGTFIYLKRRFNFSDTGKIITRLTRQNITKRRHILKKQKKQVEAGKANIKSISQSYISWRGYALKWDSRTTVYNMDKLYKNLFGKESKE